MVRNRRPGRIRWSLVVAVALLAVTAGCAGLASDDDADPADHAPAGSNALVHLDAAMLEDEDTERLLDAFAEEELDEEDADDVAEELEAELGLDPTRASELLFFAKTPESGVAGGSGDDDYSGAIVYGAWSEGEVVEGIEASEDAEYRASDFEGEPVLYEPIEESEFGDDVYLGVLDDGRYVVGDERAVRASLSTVYGDGEAVDGAVRDAYDDARDGHVRFAATLPDSYFPDDSGAGAPGGVDFGAYEAVEAIGGTYYTSDGQAGLEATLYVGDEDSARDIEDVTDGAVSFARGSVTDEELSEELRKVEIEREGTVVHLRYRSDIDDVIALLDEP